MSSRLSTILLCLCFLLPLGCLDHIPEHIMGKVIDYDTKLPIDFAFIKDSESGSYNFTNKSGQFDLKCHEPKQNIEVTKEGYKPFSIKILMKLDDNKRNIKFLNSDEQVTTNSESNLIIANSNSSCFMKGDSLVIELVKIK